MKKLYFVVFEPIKYSWILAPIQILIQIRTWGKATHVGMMWNESDFEQFLDYIRNNREIHRNEALEKFKSAGEVISAIFPKVSIQNIFEDYVNDRVFIKSIEVSDFQHKKVHELWIKRLGKERYSIFGLIWFVVAPFIDWVKPVKDIEPDKGFCSEVATNILYGSGVKVFSFMSNKFEDDLLLARKTSMDEFEKIVGEKIYEMSSKEFWNLANNTNKFYFGYKVSPRMFKLSPIFNNEGILEIKKDKVIYNE